jgi:hypothetical protein
MLKESIQNYQTAMTHGPIPNAPGQGPGLAQQNFQTAMTHRPIPNAPAQRPSQAQQTFQQVMTHGPTSNVCPTPIHDPLFLSSYLHDEPHISQPIIHKARKPRKLKNTTADAKGKVKKAQPNVQQMVSNGSIPNVGPTTTHDPIQSSPDLHDEPQTPPRKSKTPKKKTANAKNKVKNKQDKYQFDQMSPIKKICIEPEVPFTAKPFDTLRPQTPPKSKAMTAFTPFSTTGFTPTCTPFTYTRTTTTTTMTTSTITSCISHPSQTHAASSFSAIDSMLSAGTEDETSIMELETSTVAETSTLSDMSMVTESATVNKPATATKTATVTKSATATKVAETSMVDPVDGTELRSFMNYSLRNQTRLMLLIEKMLGMMLPDDKPNPGFPLRSAQAFLDMKNRFVVDEAYKKDVVSFFDQELICRNIDLSFSQLIFISSLKKGFNSTIDSTFLKKFITDEVLLQFNQFNWDAVKEKTPLGETQLFGRMLPWVLCLEFTDYTKNMKKVIASSHHIMYQKRHDTSKSKKKLEFLQAS